MSDQVDVATRVLVLAAGALFEPKWSKSGPTPKSATTRACRQSSTKRCGTRDARAGNEKLSDAAATLARAALGRAVRDIAATRRGGVEYAFLRRVPRCLVDRGTLGVIRRHVRRGGFAQSKMAGDFVRRLQAP